MSIKDPTKKSKPFYSAIPDEESFDIQTIDTTNIQPANWKKHTFVLSIIVLIAGASFGLGRLLTFEKDKTPITISSSDSRSLVPAVFPQNATALTAADLDASKAKGSPVPKSKKVATSTVATASSTADYKGTVVASKTGKKYYFPWCGSANRISASNKVYFVNVAAARKAGLLPSTTCKGLN